MNHLEFAAAESAQLAEHPYDRFVYRVEALLGHNLDGCQEEHGYSMDESYDAWRAGTDSSAYASIIKSRPSYNVRTD